MIRVPVSRQAGVLADSNIWLAASFLQHPHCAVARVRIARATKAEPLLFCRSTEQSLLRLISTPGLQRTYGEPLISNQAAWEALQVYKSMPQVRFCDEPPGTAARWHELAALPSASPKVWMDAYLAAFAIAGGHGLVTLDRDFEAHVPRGLALELLLA